MSHAFEVQVNWKDGFRGEVVPVGVPLTVPFSLPKDFGGPGDAWTPEHFYAAGVGSCVMATFLSIAKMSKLNFVSYESRASCCMEKTPEGFRMTSVTLTPRIVVSEEKERERAQRMIEKAENMCPISNSLKVTVELQASVELA